jgi:threonine dehydrogenase-like Zn-dependent dehydrogenase
VKSVVFQAPGRVSVEDRPEPVIEAPGDAIVRVTMTAVSGSDLLPYTGRRPRQAGSGMGHEVCGMVTATGSGVTRVKVGDRVVSPFSIACGGCFYCKQGLLSACETRQLYGLDLAGAQAEYVRVPNADASLETIPEGVPDEQAVFLADLLSGVYAGLQTAGIKAGSSVAVVGCGPTGLTALLLARTMGAGRVFASDHHAYRLDAATKLGATPVDNGQAIRDATEGRGVDIAVEAVGKAEALAFAADLVRPYGTLLNLGFGIEDEASFPIGRLAARRIRFVPGYGPAVKNYMTPLARMLQRGVIDPSPLVSHILPLSEAPRAYELAAKREDGALKILLKP